VKTIGLLGGMSWESTALYYRHINEAVRERLGGLHSARIALVSVDFARIEALQRSNDWDRAGELLAADAQAVEAAGADLLLLCTNTMHRCADAVAGAIRIPFLHLADATADAILARGVTRAGLLGTRFTMEQAFYRERLEARGIEVIVPHAAEREAVHRIVFDELCLGRVSETSRARMLEIMDGLRERGAAGVIEGCTEIAMLVDARHTDIPLFDTTALHADAAVDAALAGEKDRAD